ncbi:TetR/AcrR family transcriptional regulator [Antrihabitans stalactiti]|nr:TetR/AcrR family transcriptional regulator [Antrihabitans stalactiti]
MARLTRTASQARTRQLVIEAATELFLRDGFRTTSLEQIAEAAGFTRGAVYSNFANKTEMGIAVIDALYQREEHRAIAEVEAVAAQGPQAWFTALADWAQGSFGDPRWARLEIEVAAFSNGDGKLRAATAARQKRIRARGAELVADLCRSAGYEPPADLDTLSLGIVSLALGLGMQRASDPEISGAAFGSILALMFAPLTRHVAVESLP